MDCSVTMFRRLLPSIAVSLLFVALASCGAPGLERSSGESTGPTRDSTPSGAGLVVSGDERCYAIGDAQGAVVMRRLCPEIELSGDVWFAGSTRYSGKVLMVVYVTPGLLVTSSQEFVRSQQFGWTAFLFPVSAAGATFDIAGTQGHASCVVQAARVDCKET